MAEEANSRHTLPIYRWGESDAEVKNATNVVEPSGGKMDVGWLPGAEGLVGEWLNWCSWAPAVWIRYLHRVLGSWYHVDCVMPDEDSATDGVASAGVGLSVDVTAARCWLAGGLYQVPATNNLTIPTADATHPRIDLVVARVVSLLPTYALIQGTPAASPVAPAALAGDAPMWQVRVNPGAVVPTSFTDVREFGVVEVDRVTANSRLEAGFNAVFSGVALLYADGPSLIARMGHSASAQLLVNANSGVATLVASSFASITAPIVNLVVTTLNLTGNANVTGDVAVVGDVDIEGDVVIDPETFRFHDQITRKYDLGAFDFVHVDGSPASSNLGSGINAGEASWVAINTGDARLMAPVRLPNGAVIRGVRLRGTKSHANANAVVAFVSVSKATNLQLFSHEADNIGSAAGDFTISITGLSSTVDQDEIYAIVVGIDGDSGAIAIWNAEVEYTQLRPFDGL